MKWMIYIRNVLVVVGIISLMSIGVGAYKFFFPPAGLPQKDLFDWTVVGTYPNATNTVLAVLEHGVSNTGANTAPLYRVELQTKDEPKKWQNHWNVWNSHVRQIPSIKWLDKQNIEIRHVSDRVWEYEPEVELNNETYWVHLNVLPSKP